MKRKISCSYCLSDANMLSTVDKTCRILVEYLLRTAISRDQVLNLNIIYVVFGYLTFYNVGFGFFYLKNHLLRK